LQPNKDLGEAAVAGESRAGLKNYRSVAVPVQRAGPVDRGLDFKKVFAEIIGPYLIQQMEA